MAMKNLMILSMLLIEIVCNNGYTTTESAMDYNEDSIINEYTNSNHNNSVDSSHYKTISKTNNQHNTINIKDSLKKTNAQFKNIKNVYSSVNIQELKEFEKWSYEKLEALYNNEVYCSTWYGNFEENKKFLKAIRNELKILLIDDGEELLNNLKKEYKEYIRKYCNWEFYTGYGMARYFGLTRIPYVKSIFNNSKYKSAIDKILYDNIAYKFLFHYFRL